MLLPRIDAEERPEFSAQVVTEDRGRLLVRVEGQDELFQRGLVVDLEVPTERALCLVSATVDSVARTSDNTFLLLHLIVDEIEKIQRRREARFAVSYPMRFTIMREGESPSDVRDRPHGLGRVCDISLGGMQIEADYDLPNGLMAWFQVELADGQFNVVGQVLEYRRTTVGGRVYGVQFIEMDIVASRRLNRLILQLDRRKRREQQGSLPGGSARPSTLRRPPDAPVRRVPPDRDGRRRRSR